MYQNQRPGFTLVELLVVIVVMGILLTIGIVNLTSSQPAARDKTRAGNVQTIADSLEAFYSQGNNNVGGQVPPGEYPPANSFANNPTGYLTEINPDVLNAPGQSSNSIVAATNNTPTTTGVTPQPTISQYVYQPLQSDGSLCDADTKACRSFNLYYRTETDNVVHMITSRHQQ